MIFAHHVWFELLLILLAWLLVKVTASPPALAVGGLVWLSAAWAARRNGLHRIKNLSVVLSFLTFCVAIARWQ